MSESKKSPRKRKRRINWDKYTDFRSRHSKDDLAKLCAGFHRRELEYIFNVPDKTGLCPIHWAAIHNRSDLIEFLADNGARIRAKCRNKLFADGSTLHLAAMNGCIEAAGMLLRKCEQSLQETTQPKTLDTDKPPTTEESRDKIQNTMNWLSERDAEGQTALMRSAAPRSKRLDVVRDLLRKNLWSLSARPSEMALFLINKGANWRETDTKYSMNLMHLAIINDYDDIVNMLIVLDKQLINIPARMRKEESSRKSSPLTESMRNEFVTVKLDTSGPSSASSSSSSKPAESKPLIDRQEVAKELLTSGLSPLDLAIVYGRLNIISLLWHSQKSSFTNKGIHATNQQVQSATTIDEVTNDKEKLRNALVRVVCSNKDELFSLIRGSLLKILLATDLALLTLVWMPVYLTAKWNGSGGPLNLRGGIFLASYCVSLALTFRVIAKNPGYLPKDTSEYYQELVSLVGGDRAKGTGVAKLKDSKADGTQEQRDLLHLDENVGYVPSSEVGAVKNNQQAPAPNVPTITTSTQTQQHLQERRQRGAKSDLEEQVRLLCHRCRTIRKPRSRHCNYCNHCVQDFDHHCLYLGCCIGRYNRLDFLIMLVVVSLTAIYGTIIQVGSMSRNQWQQFWHLVGFIWIAKYVMIGSLNVFFNLRRAAQGITMYEEIRSNRIRRIFGPKGAPLSIMRSHRMYSTLKGSFWRHAPDRFLTGDLPARTVISNLREFTNFQSITDYFVTTLFADSSLARSMRGSSSDTATRVEMMYKYV